ncbi:RteC domain-containing protein [Flavitalea sp. BT771]|uniref:RteC domain-containing protein n=1 Tax=Flavitalea sp. BT771 TaxID=3063329 RepID=UPI0026E16B3B|nr:RteC domain-containing protein [Flavitalea sp. BT771]MDO6433289.1 RteC domain-containing protein [Flavitalea sp. BT771]MDV6222806.1 RteC domain-containing protein [Flavitalea sp. BT771]
METFVASLQNEVRDRLNNIGPEVDRLQEYYKKMEVVAHAIKKLRHHVALHPFTDKATEIQYFKSWLPRFGKQYVYFLALFKLEHNRDINDSDDFLEYLQNEKESIAEFFRSNGEFHAYCHSGSNRKDDVLFSQNYLPGTPDLWMVDEYYCEASDILAQLLAFEKYKNVINHEIRLLTGTDERSEPDDEQWLGTEAEIVELITALVAAGLVGSGGKPVTMAQGKIWAERKFNVEIKNFNVTDNNNRNRKKSATPLFDKLIRAYNDRKDRLDP